MGWGLRDEKRRNLFGGIERAGSPFTLKGGGRDKIKVGEA